jgi:hypothetical protein
MKTDDAADFRASQLVNERGAMKTFARSFCIAVIVALCGCVAATPPKTKQEAVTRSTHRDGEIELPANRTGTGAHDFYSLFANLNNNPATYGIAISASKRVSDSDTAVSVDRFGLLKIAKRQTALGGLVHVVQAEFSREQIEQAALSGVEMSVVNSKTAMKFTVPDWVFAALIQSADAHDYSRKWKLEREADKAAATRRRESYAANHADVAESVRELVLAGKIQIGMPMEAVEASWGKPHSRRKQVSAVDVSETWTYGDWQYGTPTYLIFRDGKLTYYSM